MILILTDAHDPHADSVISHLDELGKPYFRFNIDVKSLLATKIFFDGDIWWIEQNKSCASSESIKCIWARRLTVSLDLEQQTGNEDSGFRLWRSEWNRCLYGLYTSLRGRAWINPIGPASLMDNKYFQMSAARAAGFQIPDLITSNVKASLIDFSSHSSAALKFMSQDVYKSEDGTFSGIYVNRISAIDLNDFPDYGENPLTLQRYIEKDFEVRYTYVDGEHFGCKIESQKSERAKVDWRRYDLKNTPHYLIDAPDDIRCSVNRLMNDVGLFYGAFDFIVDTSQRWWYLEVNTAGQWLWIEDLVGVPISATLAKSLAARI